MTSLRLYSRPECHLCDDACDLLRETVPGKLFETVNIEDDLALVVRYGIRIPVLQRLDSGAELDWPFDDDDIEAFLGGD